MLTAKIRKVLVPTDFSAASELALDYAKALADQYGASLHLLHVLEDPFIAGAWSSEIYVADAPQLRASLRLEASRRLERILPPDERARFNVTTQVMAGAPAQAIRDVADEGRFDLIVMGTHGRAGMAHLLLGSVAEKVVRTAPCAVLTVRGDTRARETEPDAAPATVPA